MDDNLIVKEKGYTVIYDTAKDKIGYIGIDDHSGGYPYFSDYIEHRHVYDNLGQANGLLKSALKMTTYYGADKVHFDTMRVVKVSHVFQDVNEDYDRILFTEAINRIDKDDLEIIKRHIDAGGKL